MAGIKQTRANAILDSELGGTRQVRLFTVAPTATTAGTEAAGGGYAPQTISFAAAAGGQKAQSADVTFPAATADWTSPVVAWAITDGSGVQYAFRAITALPVLAGDVVKFTAGTIVVTLA